MGNYGLLMETEGIQIEQRCAIKALRIVGDAFEREVVALKREDSIVSTDYLQDLSDALHSVSGALDDLNLRLESVVDKEYERRRNKNAGIFGLD